MRYLPKLVWLTIAIFALSFVAEDAQARCRHRRHRGCGGCGQVATGCDSHRGACGANTAAGDYDQRANTDGVAREDYDRNGEGSRDTARDKSRDSARDNSDRDRESGKATDATPPPPQDESRTSDADVDETQRKKASAPQ